MCKKFIVLIILIGFSVISFAQEMRGRVDESEWRDPDDPEPSLFSYVITIAILFGIPWLISEIIKNRDKKK